MRIRCGFVSNSSSASFVVQKANLSPFQAAVIRHQGEAVKMMLAFQRKVENPSDPRYPSTLLYCGCGENWLDLCEHDLWHVEETDTEFRGHTIMTNLDLEELFEFAGIKADFKYS